MLIQTNIAQLEDELLKHKPWFKFKVSANSDLSININKQEGEGHEATDNLYY